MTRGAQIAFAILGVLTILIVGLAIANDGYAGQDAFYWRDMTGAGRADSVALADKAVCDRRPDEVFTPCMQAHGWQLWDRENTAAIASGELAVLMIVVPALLLSIAAVLLTRGRIQLWVLRGLSALGVVVVLFVGWMHLLH